MTLALGFCYGSTQFPGTELSSNTGLKIIPCNSNNHLLPWLPTPVFLPGEFLGERSQTGCNPWGCKELDMTKWLTHVTIVIKIIIILLSPTDSVSERFGEDSTPSLSLFIFLWLQITAGARTAEESGGWGLAGPVSLHLPQGLSLWSVYVGPLAAWGPPGGETILLWLKALTRSLENKVRLQVPRLLVVLITFHSLFSFKFFVCSLS